MSASVNKRNVTIEHKGNSYEVSYVRITDNAKSDFDVTVKDEALVNLIGNEFSYRLSFKDNLEELDYPPTRGEEDLMIKKLIVAKIFLNEGIGYVV